MKQKSIAVSRVYLDPQNPRHGEMTDEPSIIHHLLEKEDVKPLAKHIADVGGTSPLELIAVIPHPKIKGGFIATEGNRRMCALKLLADPDKAKLEKDKKYFRTLSSALKEPITHVNAIVFDDREIARQWFSLRHEGEQGGVGTKGWDAQQKARFSMQDGGRTPNALAVLLKDYALERGILSADDLEPISITTLTRYLSNPVLRHALGLESATQLQITVPTDQFDHALSKFLHDAMTPGSGVSSRSDAAARKRYAEQLVADGYAPTTRGLPPTFPGSSELNQTEEAPAADQTIAEGVGKGKSRNKRNPDDRKFVVPPGYVANIDDAGFQRIFHELRKIEVVRFPFAAIYLLRATIEQATVLYLKKFNVSPPKELHQKLNRAADLMEASGLDRNVKAIKWLRKMGSNVHSEYSPDTIGNFVHGGANPTSVYVVRGWDNFEPVMDEFVQALTS